MSLLTGGRVRWAALGAIVAALAAGGIAYASIPDTGGVFHACYKTVGGQVRLVNSASDCGSSETATQWNRTGPTGPTGPSDAFSSLGNGFSSQALDGTYRTVESLSLPAGNYVLNAAVEVASNSLSLADVECAVFLGNSSTTPSFRGAVPPESPGFHVAGIPVTTAVTLSATTTVSIRCIASPAESATTQPSTMAATSVASLTTS